MVFTQENVRLIVGLMASLTLLLLIVLSELGHVPLSQQSILLLGNLIVATLGIDIWLQKRDADRWIATKNTADDRDSRDSDE